MSNEESKFINAAKAFSQEIGLFSRNQIFDKMLAGDSVGVCKAAQNFLDSLSYFVSQNCDDTLSAYRTMVLCAAAQISCVAELNRMPNVQGPNLLSALYYSVNKAERVEDIHNSFINVTLGYTQFMKLTHVTSGYSKAIKDCCDYIHENIYSNLTLEDIAGAMHFSKNYIAHKFKTEVGMTITQYIRKQKVAVAKSLLDVGLPVSYVASDLGFSTQSYFAQVFKKETGMTPEMYKKKHRESH